MGQIIQLSRTVTHNGGSPELRTYEFVKSFHVVRDENESKIHLTADTVCSVGDEDLKKGEVAVELIPGYFVCANHVEKVPTVKQMYNFVAGKPDHHITEANRALSVDLEIGIEPRIESPDSLDAYLNFSIPAEG